MEKGESIITPRGGHREAAERERADTLSRRSNSKRSLFRRQKKTAV